MYQMTEAEQKFADLIWEEEPVGSGELVKLCEQGIFRNEKSVVTAVISREAYFQEQGEDFVERAFEGSLPRMIAAFMERKRLSREQIAEIEQMIENYKEET